MTCAQFLQREKFPMLDPLLAARGVVWDLQYISYWRDFTIDFYSMVFYTHTHAKMVVHEFLVDESMPMEMYGVVGLAICRHGGSKCCIWLDAEPREEFNGTIIFIGQSIVYGNY